MRRGLFITLEGGEGAGKSTLARNLEASLNDAGHEVIITREPGGTPGAEQIRDLLVQGEAERWSAMTEALLFYAARVDHVEKVIRPAISRGAIVISDRYADSTRAYQGAAGGVSAERIKALHKIALDDFQPHLTLLVDIPPEIGLGRTLSREGKEARFESKTLAFHERLRASFLEQAKEEPGRFRVLDGTKSIKHIHAVALEAIETALEFA